MATATRPVPIKAQPTKHTQADQVIVFGHSALFYGWPLWAVGYLLAFITSLHHEQVLIDTKPERFHPSQNLGVIYTLLLLLLIVITSTTVRGMKAVVVIVSLSFVTLLFAHLGWWAGILAFLGRESIYMNRGFYLYSSTALLAVWVITFGIVDHLSFWRFRPGQVTHESLGGIINKSYDTDNMVFLKRQDDILRHWILGLGSGDLHMQTMGGRGVKENVPDVLFVMGKHSSIQKLIATKPNVPERA